MHTRSVAIGPSTSLCAGPRKTFGVLEHEERAKKIEDSDAVARRREHLYQRRVTLSGASPLAQRRHQVGDSSVSPERRATLRRASTVVGLRDLSPGLSRGASPALTRPPPAASPASADSVARFLATKGTTGMTLSSSTPMLPAGRTRPPGPRVTKGYGHAKAAPLGQPSPLVHGTWF